MHYSLTNTRFLALLGLGLLAAGPLAAQTFYSNGATVVVNTAGALHVNGTLSQTGAATLRTTGTATVAGQLLGTAATTLDLSTGLLDVAGDAAHAGPLAGTTGTLRLSGPSTASLGLNGGTVPNLTIAKTGGVVNLAQPLQVRQVLTMAGTGRLDTNGQAVTLLSDASGTALLANLGTGRINGNLTVQRYLDASLNPGLGYRHLAAPVFGQSVAAFSSGGGQLVVNPAYNSAAQPGAVTPFPTVYYYDQGRLATSPAAGGTAFDKGWASPAALTDAAELGDYGFAVQLPGAQTLSFTGAAVQGGATSNLFSRDAGATAADAGWQFIGNYYASPLDWSTVGPGQRTNVDAALYVFESTSQYGGQYRSYVNGLGNGNPLIGSSQGYWVRVSQGQTTGRLSLTNSNRITTYAQQAPVHRLTTDLRPLVQLALAGTSQPDDLYLYAEAGATPALDGEYDAVKLPNTSGLNLSSSASSGEALAIDGRPAFAAATRIPLAVGVPAAGTYTLTATALRNLPAGLTAYLYDAATGQATPLVPGTAYSFAVTAAQAAALVQGRFAVQFAPATPLAATPAALAAAVSLYPNPAREQVTVGMPGIAGATAVQAELLNALGQVVRHQAAALPAAGTAFVLPTVGLAAGVYVLRLTAGVAFVTKRLTVQ